jgi:preprotein translocase subunit SecB
LHGTILIKTEFEIQRSSTTEIRTIADNAPKAFETTRKIQVIVQMVVSKSKTKYVMQKGRIVEKHFSFTASTPPKIAAEQKEWNPIQLPTTPPIHFTKGHP